MQKTGSPSQGGHSSRDSTVRACERWGQEAGKEMALKACNGVWHQEERCVHAAGGHTDAWQASVLTPPQPPPTMLALKGVTKPRKREITPC